MSEPSPNAPHNAPRNHPVVDGVDAGFPFPAVVGYDDAKLALLLCAVDPRLGGVLLRGDKGTAKSTLARGLAALLPHAPFIELPLGATEDRVVGSVDVAAALDGDGWQVRAGLLAQANDGVLYVDEVNLLAGHLVDALLDAAASGTGRVERDGLSHTYDARFVLVGSMNPEEGELRPQLLDRFGLVVDLGGHADPRARADAVRRRLAFDADPELFAKQWQAEVTALHDALAAARAHPVELPDVIVHTASALCIELGVQTLRADLTLCRGAQALARLEQVPVVTEDHLTRVAPLALAHRRRRGPFDRGTVSDDEVRDALDKAREVSAEPETEPPSGPETEPQSPPHGGPADAASETSHDGSADAEAVAGPQPERPPAERAPQSTTADPAAPVDPGDADVPLMPLHVESVARTTLVPGPRPLAGPRGTTRPAAGADAFATGRTIGARRPSEGSLPVAVAPAATLLAATARRAADPDGPALSRSDLRQPVHEHTVTRTIIVGLDTSASMGAAARIDAAREAVLRVLIDAYQRRERVALVAIGGEEARVVMQPTASVEVARARLATLVPHGPTPMASGLRAVAELAVQARRDGFEPLVVLITDGRATAGTDTAASPFDEALEVAGAMAEQAVPAAVLDAETGPNRLGLARRLADTLHARHLDLDHLDADTVEQALRGH